MSRKTRIEWADSTFNPWIGCTRVSPACDHCYAAISTATRAHGVVFAAGQPRSRTKPANWKLPRVWDRKGYQACIHCGWRGEVAEECGQCNRADGLVSARRRVFCASLADVFDNEVADSWREELFELIDATPNLDWMLLTKRVGNVKRMAPRPWVAEGRWPLNVAIGATVCNQAEADRDVPKLLRVPAAVRFLSVEPMLGPVNLTRVCDRSRARALWINAIEVREANPAHDELVASLGPDYSYSRIDWVIAGGESGPHARPMHPQWVRNLRDQCAAAGVPFHLKQWGEWAPALSGLYFHPLEGCPQFQPHANSAARTHDFGDGYGAVRIGKKAAGRLLDRQEHAEFPLAWAA